MRPEPDVRSYAVTHPAGTVVPPQPPGWRQVLFAASGAITVEPLLLPLPTDPVARAVADRVLAAPGEPGGTDRLCRGCGAARRTVERGFREETGLGVAQWRRRARLAAALEALAGGEPPSRVAARVGYATPSAFGAMVRAELGTTPGALTGT